MVECPLHGSKHEPWQCPEHTKHALQEDVMADVTKKSALDYAVELRQVKAERDQWERACKQASESYQQAQIERDIYREVLNELVEAEEGRLAIHRAGARNAVGIASPALMREAAERSKRALADARAALPQEEE